MISFLLFNSSTCSQKKDLKCVSLSFSAPVNIYKENDEIKISILRDTILVFYYSDYLGAYCLLPTAKWETGENIKGTEPYLIYNKQDSCGILFNSLTDSSIITCRIDSFLFNLGLEGERFRYSS